MSYTPKKWSEDDHGRAPITGVDMNRIESGIESKSDHIDNNRLLPSIGSNGDIVTVEGGKAVFKNGRTVILSGLSAASANDIVVGTNSSIIGMSPKMVHDAIVALIAADKGKA